MRSGAEVDLVLGLSAQGLNPTEIAAATDISRSTVKDWVAGRLPRTARPSDAEGSCPSCGGPSHGFEQAPASYPYLLGMYLGDGCISMHPRNVARLRVHLDLKYPSIIEETKRAIADLVPGNRVHSQLQRSPHTGSDEETSVVVSAYWKCWTCWLPQHGPGKKHHRSIRLEEWQTGLVEAAPGQFLRGLIHSDGCRFINTGTNWSCPRYSFSNRSEDIRAMFEWACGLLGLRTTRAPHTVYVSRKADVARLDTYVGPKT